MLNGVHLMLELELLDFLLERERSFMCRATDDASVDHPCKIALNRHVVKIRTTMVTLGV